MILDEIAAKRRIQLEREMNRVPLEAVKKAAEYAANRGAFTASLEKNGLSVIAEVKKASPSKGLLCPDFHPVTIAKAYETAGADAISVLTEEVYFQGSSVYLKEIRQSVGLPILRKDFIIHPYQIYEAKAIGADAVLLIAALLPDEALREYSKLADSLGLDRLMEIHNERELERVLAMESKLVGINNRDLKNLQVDLQTTARLAKHVPKDCVLVSESGIVTREDFLAAEQAGADAVLIGEALMRSPSIPEMLRELRRKL